MKGAQFLLPITHCAGRVTHKGGCSGVKIRGNKGYIDGGGGGDDTTGGGGPPAEIAPSAAAKVVPPSMHITVSR